ncbi:MAG TPA: chemotaxis response regulator protein-glutamate methylesterase [Polyangiaceae bacterium]|nr:chemotaxis response regulator protein-glutamate methylesterase [Polyangiaceae bacterium]
MSSTSDAKAHDSARQRLAHGKIKVLIVDDSVLMRGLLREIFSKQPDMEVVGAAPDAYTALAQIATLQPDVMTLDVEMPGMSGLTLLEKLMRERPMPVVMVSSLTAKGAETTLRALELGAVDFATKPRVDVAKGTVEMADELGQKVRNAARARPRRAHESSSTVRAVSPASLSLRTRRSLIAIGASTGGTEALVSVLSRLPADGPGVVIVQHLPALFTKPLAERLNQQSPLNVREARHGDLITPGVAFLAPGDQHLEVVRQGPRFCVALSSAPAVNRHRPSVDVLFESCARVVGATAVGVLLTGMGSDGAKGLLALRQRGARTIAQNEATCVVFGMPKEAIALGAAELVAPLDTIADAIMQ